MPTRNVVLTEHHEAVIERLVKSGRYRNAGEVLREGLRLVEQREAHDAARLEALRAAVGIGLADLDAGRFVDFASIDELEDYLTRATEARLGLGSLLAEIGREAQLTGEELRAFEAALERDRAAP